MDTQKIIRQEIEKSKCSRYRIAQETAEIAVLKDAEKTVHDPVHPSDNLTCTDLNETPKEDDASPCL